MRLTLFRKHIGRLGSEAADYLEFLAKKDAKSFEKVIVTHVPTGTNET
jgi:hypothetical protein